MPILPAVHGASHQQCISETATQPAWPTGPLSQPCPPTCPVRPPWWCRFGVVEGLEILDLLGRGACGRVYKGRWNGALVSGLCLLGLLCVLDLLCYC